MLVTVGNIGIGVCFGISGCENIACESWWANGDIQWIIQNVVLKRSLLKLYNQIPHNSII